MEDAKITQTEDQSLYKQGRFPSIVDTDDLVFELGKQVVDKLNKEKLLENIFKKAKIVETELVEVKKSQPLLIELKKSNILYEENNRKLDKKLVDIRVEMRDKIRDKDLEIEQLKKELKIERIRNTKLNKNKRLENE